MILSRRTHWKAKDKDGEYKNLSEIEGRGASNPFKMLFDPLVHGVSKGKRAKDPVAEAKKESDKFTDRQTQDMIAFLQAKIAKDAA
ncbi:hypothetical protein LCGC14_2216860, partial [marine sediment metagenome]